MHFAKKSLHWKQLDAKEFGIAWGSGSTSWWYP